MSFLIGTVQYTIQSCHNSMDAAKKQLSDFSHGTVIRVTELLSARGRQGRSWALMPGQLVMTLVLKPNAAEISRPNALTVLFMAISLAVLEPLRPYGVGIKWPNDLYLFGKKIAGILMEPVWQGDDLQGIVVGFAVNVNNSLIGHEFAAIATSLFDDRQQLFDLLQLEQSFFTAFNLYYEQWQRGDFTTLFLQWKAAQQFVGNRLTAHQRNGDIVTGIMHGVDRDGNLLLQDDQGMMHIIFFSQLLTVS